MAHTKCINKCTLTLSLNVFGIIVVVCTQMYGNEHVNYCLYFYLKNHLTRIYQKTAKEFKLYKSLAFMPLIN